MDDVLEMWPASAMAAVRPKRSCPLVNPKAVTLKLALLTIFTIALIPIVIFKNQTGAGLYVGFLVFVHVAGLALFIAGIGRRKVAATKKDWAVRLIGIAVLIILLAIVGKGISNPIESAIFWVSLTTIWFLHTVGIAMLHLRGKADPSGSLCPFL